jgi:hypothetical protein
LNEVSKETLYSDQGSEGLIFLVEKNITEELGEISKAISIGKY